ncbi:DNA excision repair protein ERCC-6-like [Notechis scutatus]|uniref:DNA excision repair protein ERCC-6-like n=1 Tax=Notechis scutatus TaxID=8663 RepID=A0A6J1UHN1_9SAUR|nr:DNA excision repair protein ERCC-6-like [Notechis scutatus]
MAELADLNPKQMEEYRRCVSQAKQEARNGNLEASLQLFQQALKIHFSEKLTANIKKLEEALASLAVEEEEDNNFVDVCQCGLMLYGEMHDKLFDYQREGVAFLYKLYRDRRKGGILADDMGLGKTIQIIAFLSGMFDAELVRSVLLILPATLLNNWVKEFAKWTPGLRVKVFHGTNKAERNRYLERIQSRKGILLTTYQVVLNNWQQLSSFGGEEFVWDYIILDEAHKIKTPSAKTTKSVHAIPSKNRILLTGTPVQNNLKELWALFDFACQGSLLGTVKTFRMEYENPITRARAKDATPGEKALGLKISENLMSIIKPYFLRRTKDELQKKKKKLELPNHLPENQSKDVAPVMPSLPRKNEFIVWVFLAPVQEEIYRNFISLDHIKDLLLSTRSPLAELNILKKLCDHPRLLSNRACRQLGLEASNYSEEEVGEDEPRHELPDMKRSIEHVSDEMLIQESGKLSVLVALLERLQYEGHRTLVFSLSRKMLDIIEQVLTHRGFKLMRIDGTVTQLAEREKRIGMFQKGADYSVFLLTTQVGGIGLTLTAASRVVIFDPSWNPATDAQAVDRAYRIGQKENVIIYRLITCGTVEEKIYRRQVFKDSLIRQSTGDKKNPYRYFTMQELKELFILEDTRSSATQLQLQSLHATQRKTDTELDEHIAYLYTLDIFGISDHDLMYTRDTAHDDEAENEEAHRYIEHRVQKAQELVQLESQLNDQHMRNIGNMTEGAWLRDIDSSTQPKTKPSKSSPGDTLGPSTSERTIPTVVESPTPSTKESPTPSPSPVVTPPIFISPVVTNEVIDLVSDDDNDAVSDMVNLSSKMTSLVVEDMNDEQMLQIISNALPSEEKEHQFPSFQVCDLNPGTTLVSPFQTHSVSIKEDYSPESSAISELPAKDMDDEEMLSHTTNMDVLHFKNKEYQQTRLQTDDQNESLNVVSSLPQATSSLIEGSVNSESKMISCDPSPEARRELKDVQMKLLQESVVYPSDDGMHRTETDMSLDVLHGDPCEINEVDAVAPHQALVSKMTESITLQNSGTRETEQFKCPDISSHYQQMRNIINTTEGSWLRDTDSSNQSKTKPSKTSSGDTLGPSTSERTIPTVVESPAPSTKKSPTPPPSPVVTPPVFISPVITNEAIDLVSDDNDGVSDMVSLSSKMTSLVVEDVNDEQMLQIISNTEDALPSEEKEHQFPSFQVCDLNPGTTLVSPFQTHSVSIKEDYSPESRAISELPAKDTDNEQMLSHTTNMDVLHFKNKEYQRTGLQTDDQNESLNVVSSLPQATSSSIEGNVNSESKMISCDPFPDARSKLKDVQMKLFQESVSYPSKDGIHQTEADMSLDVLPISHGNACEINEADTVAPHQALVSKTTESSALQISGTRETAQFKSPDIPFLYQVNFNLAFEDSEHGPQTISEKDTSLEETANEGFQLKLDSYCSSATESVGKEHRNHRSLQTSNGVESSVVMDDSNGPCDSGDSFGLGKKKRPAMIVSDEEEENDELIDELDEDKPDGICMSTPKTDRPVAAICFSPRVKLSGRRSTASRRSFLDMVLEEVEDAAREAGTVSNVSNDRSVQQEYEEELTQNYTEQTSAELEEEPSGETLDSESEFSHFYDADSSRGESFSEVAI